MPIKAKLTKDQLFRLSLMRHIEKPTFFFNAFTSAGLLAYAIWQDIYIILFLAWMPVVLYIALGAFEAFHASRDRNNPLLLQTQYDVSDKGIGISTPIAESHLAWDTFDKVKLMLDCYVLFLKNGQMLAIPKKSVPAHLREEFEGTLRRNLSGPKK